MKCGFDCCLLTVPHDEGDSSYSLNTILISYLQSPFTSSHKIFVGVVHFSQPFCTATQFYLMSQTSPAIFLNFFYAFNLQSHLRIYITSLSFLHTLFYRTAKKCLSFSFQPPSLHANPLHSNKTSISVLFPYSPKAKYTPRILA